ncbi:MAG: hypothetical protein V7L25_06125 [Nostoc sp.]
MTANSVYCLISAGLELKKKFKLAEAGNNACGRKPIKEYHPKIRNEDATYYVGKSHSLTQYFKYLPELVKNGL